MTQAISTLEEFRTYIGQNVLEVSNHKKVLLVFLRHFGCSFCREAMYDIYKLQSEKSLRNLEIILVHMAAPEVGFEYLRKYKISHLDHISDPECRLYSAFGLTKANFNQLFGFRSWVRGIEAGLIKGHGWGLQLGDGFQMPGIFVISKRIIIAEFRHTLPSDKPNYERLVNCRLTHTKQHNTAL